MSKEFTNEILEVIIPGSTAKHLGRLTREAIDRGTRYAIYGLTSEIKAFLATDHEPKNDDFLSNENYFDSNNQKYIDTEGFKGLVICNQRNDTTVNPEYYSGETQTLYVLGETSGGVIEFNDRDRFGSDLWKYSDGNKHTLQVIRAYLEAEHTRPISQ